MRRLQNLPPAAFHDSLLALRRNERPFVQRWIELFDWEADVQFQARPISRRVVELELKDAEGFHISLLTEELNSLPLSAIPFSYDLIDNDPVKAAEILAADPGAAAHHPVYLFHGHRAMLGRGLPDLESRLTEMRRKWNAGTLSFRFYFRIEETGAKPTDFPGSRTGLVALAEVAQDVRAPAAAWVEQAAAAQLELARVWLLRIEADGADVNAALESALRTYYVYRGCMRAASPGSKAIAVDLSTVLVEYVGDPTKNRLLPIQPRRFRMRGGTDVSLRTRLEQASQSWRLFGDIVRNFGEAVAHLRVGDVDSALEALAFNQDLAFLGYASPLSNESQWRQPRFLVELGSRLLAMDHPRRSFDYIATYCGNFSHTVELEPGRRDTKYNRTLIVDREPWQAIVEDARWSRVILRSDWDELLKRRRTEFLELVGDLRGLANVQRVVAWDLARAVRARNLLIHEGECLGHHRAVGVLLNVNELVILLRLAAYERAPAHPDSAFHDLIAELRSDFDRAIHGTYPSAHVQRLCTDGWNGIGAG